MAVKKTKSKPAPRLGVFADPEPQPVEESIAGYRDFAQVVAQMRRAQKAYFTSRKEADLIEAKKLETAVDMRLGVYRITAIY